MTEVAIKAKAEARVVANLAVMAKRLRRHDGEKELESRTLEQTVVQRPPPLPRLHRTLSSHGATSQHGPRFKRTRFGAPHEVKMVEEIHQCSSPGDAVDDSIGMDFDFDAMLRSALVPRTVEQRCLWLE